MDGVYGTATANAVRAFQRKYGLTVDGMVGRDHLERTVRPVSAASSPTTAHPTPTPAPPLREGSSGQNVRLVQFWLKIARTVYTSLESVTVDGKFGAGHGGAVRRFQRYFGLTGRRRGGPHHMEKAVRGVQRYRQPAAFPSLRPGEYPGVLRTGSSGTAVRELQFYLYLMSAYESSIPPVSIDGKFGADTERAVRAYQRFAGLTVDGIVGRTTWNSLYGRASQLRSSGPVVTFKASALPRHPADSGAAAARRCCTTLPAFCSASPIIFPVWKPRPLPTVTPEETATATRSAQQLLGWSRPALPMPTHGRRWKR